MTTDINEELSSNDIRLIEEAIKRLRSSCETITVDRKTLFKALATEFHRGRRDMFSLVKAGSQLLGDR